MKQSEYIQSLENLLIFMCQTYEEQQGVLRNLAKEGNRAILEVPRIQGSHNLNPIAELSKMDFQRPQLNFQEVKENIKQKRLHMDKEN